MRHDQRVTTASCPWVVLVAAISLPVMSLAAAEDLRPRIQGQAVLAVCAKPQMGFRVASLGGALLGPLIGGAAVDKPKGSALVERFGIPDPAFRVRQTFLAELAVDPSLVKVLEGVRPDDVSLLRKELGSEGLALQFRTVTWGLLPHGGGHQRIEYWAWGRLVDLGSGKVVWKETAKFIGKEPEGQRPTSEAMVADNGAVLKAKLDEGADKCARELVRRFTGKE